MNKKIGAITFILLLCLGSAYAGARYEKINVYFGAVRKIFVDGVDKTETFKEPILYDGTTYVALRDVSEALGKNVDWDAENKTIYMGEKPLSFRIDEVRLSELDFYATHNVFLLRINNDTEHRLNIDKDASYNYPHDYKMKIRRETAVQTVDEYNDGVAIRLYEDATALYYDVNEEYHLFKGIVGFDFKENNDQYKQIKVRFLADRKVVKEVTLNTENIQELVEVPLGGAKMFQIEFLREGSDVTYDPYVNIVNGVLEKHIYN